MARLLKGKEVANAIDDKTSQIVNALKQKNIIPTLAIVRVGENEADISYEKGACKRANNLGVEIKSVVLPIDVAYDTFYTKLDELNNDDNVDGILLLRPLPKELDNDKARNYLNPKKDVDGCTNASLAGIFTNTKVGFAPCTAQAAIEMLDYYNIETKGKKIVVIGRSLVVGKPLSMLLLNKDATVTICHSKTNNIESITKNADIVLAATGQMESLNKKYFSDKQTVIDIGINYNETKQKLCGDVLFEEVEPIVENITPVPGGVGSVTNSVLINHVAIACQLKHESN